MPVAPSRKSRNSSNGVSMRIEMEMENPKSEIRNPNNQPHHGRDSAPDHPFWHLTRKFEPRMDTDKPDKRGRGKNAGKQQEYPRCYSAYCCLFAKIPSSSAVQHPKASARFVHFSSSAPLRLCVKIPLWFRLRRAKSLPLCLENSNRRWREIAGRYPKYPCPSASIRGSLPFSCRVAPRTEHRNLSSDFGFRISDFPPSASP